MAHLSNQSTEIPTIYYNAMLDHSETQSEQIPNIENTIFYTPFDDRGGGGAILKKPLRRAPKVPNASRDAPISNSSYENGGMQRGISVFDEELYLEQLPTRDAPPPYMAVFDCTPRGSAAVNVISTPRESAFGGNAPRVTVDIPLDSDVAYCQNCSSMVRTYQRRRIGAITHAVALPWLLLMLFPFTILVYLLNTFRYIHYHCSSCSVLIGYRRPFVREKFNYVKTDMYA